MNESTYDFSSKKRSTKKFLEVSCCSRAKQRQRNVQKKCATRATLLSLLIRPIVVFHRFPALPLQLSITRFYIKFEQTLHIIESFAFCNVARSETFGWRQSFLLGAARKSEDILLGSS